MKRGRKPKNTVDVLSVLAADTSPIGQSHAGLVEATGMRPVQVSAALRLLILAGQAHRFGKFKDSRFVSIERAEACQPAFDAHTAALKAMRHERMRTKDREAGRRYYAKKHKKPAWQKAQPKPKHKQQAMTINPAMNAAVHVPKAQAPKWKDMPAIKPDHVKVQCLPGFKDDRYTVTGPVIGGFKTMGIGRYLEAA